jgi:hypothetical protein
MQMKKMLATLLVIFAIVVAFDAFAQAPSRQTVLVNNGTGTFTYSGGIQNPAYNMFRVTAVITPSAAGTTNTISVVDGTVTNLVATKAVAANDSAAAVTNDWWHFVGDKVVITSSATNAFTAQIIIEEK